MESKKELILIEILQHQIPCSKEMAREALRKHDYNIIAAHDELRNNLFVEEEIHAKGYELLATIKKLLSETNLIHLKVQKDDKTLLSIPITLSAAFMYIYPYLTTLSMYLLLRNEFSIKILRTRSE